MTHFTKDINVFRSKNLALFRVNGIQNIRDSTKNRHSEVWKTTEKSRLKQVNRQRN